MDSCLDQLNWLNKLDARMKEFMGRIYLDKMMQQRQYGYRMNQNHQHHHCQENTQRVTQTVIKLLPSVINRIPASLAAARILPPLCLCLPPPAFPSSPWSLLRNRDDKSIHECLGRPPSQHVNFDKLATTCLWPPSNVLELL